MVKEEIKEILNSEGVTPEYIIQKYKDIAQVRQEYPNVIQLFKDSQFTPEIIKGLSMALDDFGERPIIVRSSSLLEDSFGAALDYISLISLAWKGNDIFIQAVLFYGAIVFLLDLGSWWRSDEVPVSADWPAPLSGLIYGIMIILLSFIGATNAQPFIYFQF